MGHMYDDTKTWNPFVGCDEKVAGCIYCKPSFKAQLKRQRCPKCKTYEPHYHPERLTRIPSAKRIFVCGTGDIRFATVPQFRAILEAVKAHSEKHPETEYFFQSKFPSIFNMYVNSLPKTAVIITTLETNRDTDYEKISKAPLPMRRWIEFRMVDHPRKILTVEPLLDFDLDIFKGMIISVKPLAVYIGYNSRPKQVKLPEPSWSKVRALIEALEAAGIEVRPKDLRRTSCKARISDISCGVDEVLIPEEECPCDRWKS